MAGKGQNQTNTTESKIQRQGRGRAEAVRQTAWQGPAARAEPLRGPGSRLAASVEYKILKCDAD